MRDNKLKMCDLCGEEHLEIKKRIVETELKGEAIEYESEYAYCPDLDENILIENMLDKNLNRMRNAYRRKVNLLTSDELVDLRSGLGMSQKNMGIILGMGEATIGRIESKVIQDRTTDDTIRRIKEDPIYLLTRLEIVRDKIGEKVYKKILSKLDIEKEISIYNYKILEIKYSQYKEYSKLNGMCRLDLEKIENMIIYFVNNCKDVFKTKLNKLLWYTDFKNFKETEKGITGLVYTHKPFGAVPIGIEEILKLSTKIKIEEKENKEYGSTYSKITSLSEFNEKLFNPKELNLLEKVAEKFKKTGNREISDYMHEEEAYIHTKNDQVINYKFGNQLKEF